MSIMQLLFYGSKSSVSGGTISQCGDQTVHTFTSTGPLIVSGSPIFVSYLVVAGGGGGGQGSALGAFTYFSASLGGGGGGGGARTGLSLEIPVGNYTVQVGGGGAGATGVGSPSNGSPSILHTITSTGGGGGATGTSDVFGFPAGIPGGSGGSGGGGGGYMGPGPSPIGGAGGAGNSPPVTPPQGTSGTPGGSSIGYFTPPIPPPSAPQPSWIGKTAPAGNGGGLGLNSSISCYPIVYSSPGTGGSWPTPAGASPTLVANRGHGGAGGWCPNTSVQTSNPGQTGSSGIVIISYPT